MDFFSKVKALKSVLSESESIKDSWVLVGWISSFNEKFRLKSGLYLLSATISSMTTSIRSMRCTKFHKLLVDSMFHIFYRCFGANAKVYDSIEYNLLQGDDGSEVKTDITEDESVVGGVRAFRGGLNGRGRQRRNRRRRRRLGGFQEKVWRVYWECEEFIERVKLEEPNRRCEDFIGTMRERLQLAV